MEEVADLQGFSPSRAHLLLREVYGYFPHQNDNTYLEWEVLNNAVWKSCWRKLATQSASWDSTPPSKVGRRFTAVLAEE